MQQELLTKNKDSGVYRTAPEYMYFTWENQSAESVLYFSGTVEIEN